MKHIAMALLVSSLLFSCQRQAEPEETVVVFAENPSVESYCSQREVGPEEIPLRHPVVEIMGTVAEPDLWLEVVAMTDGGEEEYLIAYMGSMIPSYWITLDGYVQSIRDGSRQVLTSGTLYLLRGWRVPYPEDGYPTFEGTNPVVFMEFYVPDCTPAPQADTENA